MWWFFLPGTFLHELAHFLPAYYMGKVVSFSLRPRRSEKGIIFGEVVYLSRTPLDRAITSISPCVYWLVLVFWMQKTGFFNWKYSNGTLDISFVFDALGEGIRRIFLGYCFLQLLWAGRVSSTDIAIFIEATWVWWVVGIIALYWAWSNFIYIKQVFMPVIDFVNVWRWRW